MSYYSEDLTQTKDAPFIKEAIKTGLIDSVHSWGDFNDSPPKHEFLKLVADRVVSDITSEQLKIKVWINHGSPNNYQNLGCRLQRSYKGDDPKSRYYTLNLVKQLGIKCYWDSEIIPWPLTTRKKIHSIAHLYRNINLYLVNCIKKATGKMDRMRSKSDLFLLGRKKLMQDGTRLIRFSRYNRHPSGCWILPTRETIRYGLDTKVLNDLIKQEGYLIVYTHLGLPQTPTVPLFPRPDRQALETFAELFHDGYIWVAPTERLLTYWMMTENLKWKYRSRGDNLIIDILSINDPIDGERKPELEELCGLSFYSPCPQRTTITVCGENTKARIFPKDHTFRGGIGFEPFPSPSVDLIGD